MQKQIISLLLKTGFTYKYRVILSMSGAVLAVLSASFLAPYIVSRLLNHLQSGTLDSATMLPLIIAYALSQIFGEIILWRMNMFTTWTFETAAQRDLYQKVFDKLTSLSTNFHANRFGGALVSQTTKLVGSFERFWDTIIFQLMPSITSIVAATIILSFVLWQYALVLLTISILFVLLVFFGSKFMAKRNTEESQASTRVTARVADAITNILAIKSHGAEKTEFKDFQKHTETWRGKSLSTMRGFLLISTGYSTLMTLLNISAFVAAIWASKHNIISLADVYLCVTYTLTVSRQLWEMNNIMRNYNRIIGDAHDMTEILALDLEVADASNKKLKAASGALSFNDVTFIYKDNGHALFENFNLHIQPGEKIGLVGHSGSGKTTLTKILLRFMNIDSGSITIDSQDTAIVTQASLRSSIAYVPQEPLLFHRTLRENIAYGKPNATMEQIIDAAKKAHALEFINKLPDGFETMVGERGVKLSGGQRQRVAIARAILKDAPILVLDEATSALDSESEVLIQKALWELMKGRTTIVIAHRLSTIQKMDRIIVLEDGKIAEEGPHATLVTKPKGTYAKLWKHQSGGFIEE